MAFIARSFLAGAHSEKLIVRAVVIQIYAFILPKSSTDLPFITAQVFLALSGTPVIHEFLEIARSLRGHVWLQVRD
jgi:hypothetical protein